MDETKNSYDIIISMKFSWDTLNRWLTFIFGKTMREGLGGGGGGRESLDFENVILKVQTKI